MTYRIKRVDGTDDETADTLKWMHDVCFGHTAPQVEPERGHWWIAYFGTQVAAFAALSQTYACNKTGYLKRVGVFPEHRGHGLQLRLIRVREALARKIGWKGLVTDTTNNPASSNTLIKAGYRLYTPESKWAFEHSLYWQKEL